MREPQGEEASATGWLLGEWTARLTSVLLLMGDARPTVKWQAAPALPAGEPLWWRAQPLSLLPEPAIRLGAPAAAWRHLGTRVLRAAGVDPVEESDARSTYLEIVSQSFSGLAQSLRERLQCEVTCGPGVDLAEDTPAEDGFAVSLAYADTQLPPLVIAFSPSLTSKLEEQAPAGERAPSPAPAQADTACDASSPTEDTSKILEVLLDLALPISISFGSAQLALSEVMKLGPGSVIDLDSSLHEPVEITVNGRVVGWGEVVVINGNYGVRVEKLAGPEELVRAGVPEQALKRFPGGGSPPGGE